MYLLPNPTTLTIHVRQDPKVPGNLVFSDAEFFVRCELGRRPERHSEDESKAQQCIAVPFKLLEVTRSPDCKHVEHSVWRVDDGGPTGNGTARLVRIRFDGGVLTKLLSGARQNQNITRDDPRLVLRETILHQARLGMLIEIADRKDPARVDNLLVDLRYLLRAGK